MHEWVHTVCMQCHHGCTGMHRSGNGTEDKLMLGIYPICIRDTSGRRIVVCPTHKARPHLHPSQHGGWPHFAQKLSKNAIFSLHRGNSAAAAKQLLEAEAIAKELLPTVAAAPSLRCVQPSRGEDTVTYRMICSQCP